MELRTSEPNSLRIRVQSKLYRRRPRSLLGSRWTHLLFARTVSSHDQAPGGDVIHEGVGPWLMRCRTDGSDVEIVSGAVGNPVEVTFLASGDAILQGTFWAKPSAPDGLRDALVHAVLGGEYSVRDRDYSDRIRTGDFLPALVPLTNTAPSGLTAFHSDLWGPRVPSQSVFFAFQHWQDPATSTHAGRRNVHL